MQTVISNSVSGSSLYICLMTSTSKPNICVYLSSVLIFSSTISSAEFPKMNSTPPTVSFQGHPPGMELRIHRRESSPLFFLSICFLPKQTSAAVLTRFQFLISFLS